MSYEIQRPTDKMDDEVKDIIQGIIKNDPFCNETEESLLEKILADVYEEEKSMETCRKMFKFKHKELSQEQLENMKRKLDILKSKIAKKKKDDFKHDVKELCDIDIFDENVTMHLPKPKADTMLHEEAGRVLDYLTKRNELSKMLGPEVKWIQELEASKGPNSVLVRRRRELSSKLEKLYQVSFEIFAGISQIEKALESFSRKSQVTYAKMVSAQLDNIKAKLFALIDETKQFERDLKKHIREGRRSFNSIPDYIDDDCDICVKREKRWDDRWASSSMLEPLGVKDARNFHARFFRSGGMRGLVDQFKSLLSCEVSDPSIALSTLVGSMADPKRADNLYNLISTNNFLKDFKQSILKKSKKDIFPITKRKECMVCNVRFNKCSF